ncbi:MAG: LapA family protein [Candidatus Riflebacteria bacterium]|nr:LapA family protein [Candidatus Riflebacteria bacterium]
MRLQIILILFIVLAMIILALQNPNPVKVCCLDWETEPMPIITVILISFFTGILFAYFFTRNQTLTLKQLIRQRESEIENLKIKLSPVNKILLDGKEEA